MTGPGIRNAFLRLALVSGMALSAATQVDRLLWHDVRLDSSGRLLSWVRSASPYDVVIRKAWSSFLRIPVQPDGYRTYFTYPTFYGPGDPNHPEFSGRWWCHNPGGFCAMLTDSAILYYAYSGNLEVRNRAGRMIDHLLSHGLTSPSDSWSSVPYACSDPGDPVYRGATDSRYSQNGGKDKGRGDGVGFIEPDKVGEIGRSILAYYEATLDPKYLRAAIRCADALADHCSRGDASHSPWPFRVDAASGQVVREAYTANAIGPIKLFDELIRIGRGRVTAYRRARRLAWDWLMRYPIRNQVWTQYFEDVLIYDDYRFNRNQYIPLETARYLMEHPNLDPNWRAHSRGLIAWVAHTFAADSKTMAGIPEKGRQWGAEVLSEQFNDMDKMSSHTARFASVLALWTAVTGDRAARERAFRSFNWSTYAVRDDGLVKTSIDEGTGYWFSDGYGDTMRHFQRGLAYVPEWAPPDRNHLLGSTSVVRRVDYAPRRLAYVTFDRASREVLRLRVRPLSVLAGSRRLRRLASLPATSEGYCLTHASTGGFVIRIAHRRSGEVTVRW